MALNQSADIQSAITALKKGGLVVLRTDTLYGIVAKATDEQAVSKVYQAKKRNAHKQCIVLITNEHLAASPKPLTIYGQQIMQISDQSLRPTSLIVPGSNEPAWLLAQGQPGDQTMAYRLVNQPKLVEIINSVGPLIAPSANPEGLMPAANIAQAKQYFGDLVDFYLDGGEVPVIAAASQIVRLDQTGDLITVRS